MKQLVCVSLCLCPLFNMHLVNAVMLTLPFRGFAEILIGVNFFQTELLLFQPAVYHKKKLQLV